MNNGFSGQLPGLGKTKKKDLLDDIDIDNMKVPVRVMKTATSEVSPVILPGVNMLSITLMRKAEIERSI